MKRYIDAEALKKRAIRYPDYHYKVNIEDIDNMPTADVQEVNHGKWLESGCSECGREAVFQDVNGIWRFENYCPHCGAKIDGGLK